MATSRSKSTSRKTSQKSSSSSASKKSSSSTANKNKESAVVTGHAFPPGTKVSVHKDEDVQAERLQKDPAPDATKVSTATVDANGVLEVNVPKKGRYQVVGEVENPVHEPNRQGDKPGLGTVENRYVAVVVQ
jgi:hypothetical protein